MKIIFILFVLIIITLFHGFKSVNASTLWPVQSVDTMKYSRDISREPDILKRIPKYVEQVASLKPTHIAIATPYNEEFYPVLSMWVSEARKHNLKVWFRGNWSEWEGWFDYKKFTDYRQHHEKTQEFILKHPELFESGDIFTPAPEPENGGLGDPRGSHEKTLLFREFLITSFNTCTKAMQQINMNDVLCGYFSVNGDVARESLDKATVQNTGKVVVIDHFVKSPEKLVKDIEYLAQKYEAKVVLGEIGAPIPDIHGEMSELEQATYIAKNLAMVLSLKDKVGGINYWTAFGGSTRVFESNGTPRKVADTIQSFFNPPRLTGVVQDQYGNRISGASISVMQGAIVVQSNYRGVYDVSLPGTLSTVTVSAGESYKPITFELGVASELRVKNIVLQKTTTSFLDTFILSIKGLLARFGLFTGQR